MEPVSVVGICWALTWSNVPWDLSKRGLCPELCTLFHQLHHSPWEEKSTASRLMPAWSLHFPSLLAPEVRHSGIPAHTLQAWWHSLHGLEVWGSEFKMDGKAGVSTELSEEKDDKPWGRFRIAPMFPHSAQNPEESENFKLKPNFPGPHKVSFALVGILVNSLWSWFIMLKNSDIKYVSLHLCSCPRPCKYSCPPSIPLGGMRAQTRPMAQCLHYPQRPSIHGLVWPCILCSSFSRSLTPRSSRWPKAVSPRCEFVLTFKYSWWGNPAAPPPLGLRPNRAHCNHGSDTCTKG